MDIYDKTFKVMNGIELTKYCNQFYSFQLEDRKKFGRLSYSLEVIGLDRNNLLLSTMALS